MSTERSRFADDFNDDTFFGFDIVAPSDRLPPGVCGCGCGRSAAWEDRYVSDRRPSVEWAEHRDAAVALVVAVGGSGVTVLGPAAAGDDGIGDELGLSVHFPAGIDASTLNRLAEALEALLDVGVHITVAQR